MIEELEAIVEVGVRDNSEEVLGPTRCYYLGDESFVVGPDSEADKVLNALSSICSQLPDDFAERRERAAEILAERIGEYWKANVPDLKQQILNTPFHALEMALSAARHSEEPIIQSSNFPENFGALMYVLGHPSSAFDWEYDQDDSGVDFPGQWLEVLPERQAEFLYCALQHGDDPFANPMICDSVPPDLESDGFVDSDVNLEPDKPRYNVYAQRAPFQSGLELPDCVDEEDL